METSPTTWLKWIHDLDHQPNNLRRKAVEHWLIDRDIPYRHQVYPIGINLVAETGEGPVRAGLACHYDRVHLAGGGNDNASAMAVCLMVLERVLQEPDTLPPLRVFFFDEEETGLKGSAAWVREKDITDLTCLLNLEMMGMGDRFAIWPVPPDHSNRLITAAHQAAYSLNTSVHPFDRIVTNTADHVSFQKAGMEECFSLTCISQQELITGKQYYEAMAKGASLKRLAEIMEQAPLFRHYHQPSDTADKLSVAALALSADMVWETLRRMK